MVKLAKMIGIIERCIIQYRNKDQKELNINGCLNPYFYVLSKKSGVTQDELSKDLHINKSNITRGIQFLKEYGYVDVRVDESDKRVNRVYLNEQGKLVFQLIKEKTKKCNEKLLEGFSKEEIEQFDSLLSKLVANAERMCEYENI